MIGKNNTISRLCALVIFTIMLVGGNGLVQLCNESDIVIFDNKELADSNTTESSKEISKITAKVLVSNPIEELEIVAETKVKEEALPEIVYDGLTFEELTNKLNRVLSSTLAGTGESFARYSLELGVDPYLALGIVFQETGCYYGACSAMVNQCYNIGGLKGGNQACGGYIAFSSLDEGIHSYINILYNNYISKGLNTAEIMNPYYAEDTQWASKVNNYINIIKNS